MNSKGALIATAILLLSACETSPASLDASEEEATIADSNADDDLETDPPADADATSDTHDDTNTDSVTDVGSDRDTGADTVTWPDIERVTDTDPPPPDETDSGSSAVAPSDTDSVTASDTWTQTITDTGTVTDTGTENSNTDHGDTATDTAPDADTTSETLTSDTRPDTETFTDTATDADTATTNETETATEIEATSDTGISCATYSFQNGANGYDAMIDIALSEQYPTEPYADAASLAVDLDPKSQVLMRFDALFGEGSGQIPETASIISAEVRVYATDPTTDDISIHRMLVAWSESSTWSSTASGVSSNGTEAAILPDDTQFGPGSNAFYAFDITPSVAAWRADPATNQGVVLLDSGTNGWDLYSSEWTTASQRPQLTVEACTGGGDTETGADTDTHPDTDMDTVTDTDTSAFSFMVTSDIHQWTGLNYDDCGYFRGAADKMKAVGEGVFLITSGDISPGADARWTIDAVLGQDYLWYPAVGNHEMPGRDYEPTAELNMNFLRNYDRDANGQGIQPDIVSQGPSGCPTTTYSFDYGNAHFAVLNVYCDLDGDTNPADSKGDYNADIPDHLYNWLATDLAATTKPFIFVAGHEPAFPMGDEDVGGRERHMDDGLNEHIVNRDRFWALLTAESVTAYFCGHTHNYDASLIDGVWQINSGNTQGDHDFTPSAPNTFVKVTVGSGQVDFETYRSDTTTFCNYTKMHEWSAVP